MPRTWESLSLEEERELLSESDSDNGERSPRVRLNPETGIMEEDPSEEVGQLESNEPYKAEVVEKSSESVTSVAMVKMLKLLNTLSERVDKLSETSRTGANAPAIEPDQAYVTPPFHVRSYTDSEKLQGHRNFKSWYRMIVRDLKALRLLPFAEARFAEGLVQVSEGKRETLENQAFQLVFAACSKTVAPMIDSAESTFAAMQKLKRVYDTNRIEDIARLDARFESLRYVPGSSFTREKYVHEFQQIISEFAKHGQHYLENVKAARFLRKIQGVYDPTSPFFHMYNSVTALEKEEITLEFAIEKFLAVSHVQEKSNSNSSQGGNKRKSFSGDNSSSKRSKSEKPAGESSSSSGANTKSKPKPTPSTPSSSSAPAKSLRDKYSEEQLEKLNAMSAEERKNVQCSKCGDYFHNKSKCTNPGRMCYVCKQYGHESSTCKWKKNKEPKC